MNGSFVAGTSASSSGVPRQIVLHAWLAVMKLSVSMMYISIGTVVAETGEVGGGALPLPLQCYPFHYFVINLISKAVPIGYLICELI